MPTMRKLYLPALLLLALCLLLCACGNDCGGEIPTTAPTTTTATPTTVETAPPDLALNGYTFIRSENADSGEITRYSELYQTIRDMGDHGLKISDDFLGRDQESDPNAAEILCGQTNRPETARALAALPGYYDWSVSTVGQKLCLVANNDAGMDDAIAYLLANLRVTDGTLYYTGGSFIGQRDYPLADATLSGASATSFTIVYAADDENGARTAEKLSLWFAEKTGKKLPIAPDTAAAQANEIIIGKTNRAASSDPATLERNTYRIAAAGGNLVLAAASASGYTAITERMETLMTEQKLTADFTEEGTFTGQGLDGARVMFVGNSFLYYGYCTTTKNKIVFDDQGYFHQVAEAMGDDVDVTSVTYGGKGLKSLYSILLENHPKHYGTNGEMDNFYDQDYVILQQEGSNASSTEEMAYKIMKLFPPETKFCFFIHHHNVQNNHRNVIGTAEKLRDEEGVIYIPEGHLVHDIWIKRTKVPGATLTYNKNSFVVNHTDTHHPNYLNGYLTALTCYYAITGNSIIDCPHDFVRTTMEYYTNATSNYKEILASDADMRGLKQLVEQYVEKYNS